MRSTNSSMAMAKSIFVLLLFSSAQASALEVMITAKTEGDGKPTIVGKTNLPDGVKLMITIQTKDSNYFAQANTEVKNGAFKAGPFSNGGASLARGSYSAEVTMPLVALQPTTTQSVLGNDGANLSGPLTEKSILGGKTVRYRTNFAVTAP